MRARHTKQDYTTNPLNLI